MCRNRKKKFCGELKYILATPIAKNMLIAYSRSRYEVNRDNRTRNAELIHTLDQLYINLARLIEGQQVSITDNIICTENTVIMDRERL